MDVVADVDERDRMVLRAATADDLADLVRLAHDFYDEDGFTAADDDIRARFDELLTSRDARIAVVVHDGATCAFALTTVRLILESGLVAELQDLFVEPDHRRMGIANALIDDATEWARAQSASLLEVVVAPNGRDVTNLVDYYRLRGFADEGRRLLGRAL